MASFTFVLFTIIILFQVPLGIDNLITIDEPTRRKVFERAQRGGGGVNSKDSAEGSKKAWGVGEMEFEAHMRMLDNAVSVLDFSWNIR